MRILMLALCLTIMGCGGGSDSAKEEADKESVFDPLVGNIDKAMEVEKQIMEQKDQLDQAIKDAEAGVSEIEDEAED